MATVTNLSPNPRAASNVTGMEAFNASSGAPSQLASDGYRLGTCATETSTPPNAATATGIYMLGLTSGYIAVSPGDLIVVRCAGKIIGGNGSGATAMLRLLVNALNSSGVSVETAHPDIRESCANGQWYELIGFYKVPATAVRLAVAMNQRGSTSSTTVRATELMVYKNPPLGVGLAPYADTTATYAPPGKPDPAQTYTCFNDNAPNRGTQKKVEVAQWVQLLLELGATSVRFGSSADAAAMESLNPSARNYNFGYWEPWLNAAIAAGIRPILIAPVAPSWMRGSNNYNPDAAHLAVYGDFCAAFAARFPEAAAFELWNEPNYNVVWGAGAGVANVAEYVAFMQAVYPKVKAAVPSMPVLGCATAHLGSATVGPSISADTFISGVYAGGGKNYMDGIAIHAYVQDDTRANSATSATYGAGVWALGIEEHLRVTRKAKDANGDSAKPIWITEMGASVISGGLSEAEQAFANRVAVEMLRDRTRNPDIRCISFNQVIHHVADGSYPEGLAHVDTLTLRRRASFGEVQQAFGGGRPPRRPHGSPVNRVLGAPA